MLRRFFSVLAFAALPLWAVPAGGMPGSAGERPPVHWSVQPLRVEDAPGVSIDTLVRSRLEEKGLALSPRADRRTLIRRLSFDLLGLPPSPERVESFVADPDPEAYARLVDEFLASPHYGERWARHWLDIAHYADTHGFERDQIRPNAWRYRDYVIRALNSDKPYDQFLREQIAGDVIAPDDPDAVSATGFLAAGPWDFVGQQETPSPVIKRLARADDLDDMVTQVMSAACAMTVNCARCHDHKLDPISQEEYFALTAVFAGVKRGERDTDRGEVQRLAGEAQQLRSEIAEAKQRLATIENSGLSLADMAGGGDGTGTGAKAGGLNPGTGKSQPEKAGLLEGVKVNTLSEVAGVFVDSVVIPDGDGGVEIPISTAGHKVRGIPRTSGAAWDAIRNGPVNAQKSTETGGVDFHADGHALLGLHANAAITFDLHPVRAALRAGELRFRADIGYGGRPQGNAAADVRVFVDGEVVFLAERLAPESGRHFINVLLPESARFLTLMATEGADGISHDQVFFGDPLILPARPALLTAEMQAERDRLRARLAGLEQRQKSLPEPARVYGVVSETAPAVHVQFRGDPEQPRGEVAPAALRWVAALPPELAPADGSEGERRRALAAWITSPANPLTARVMVNRLWHHHFGTGLVDTPSDFGHGGGLPSHPELLDWLARRFLSGGWSVKAMHRLMVNSEVYRQSSPAAGREGAAAMDAGNRLLWRMNPRRLDAESLHDAVLAVSGKLNRTMFGPGYRDFDYKEEYAPVYRYITPDRPELWRRSLYRFVVRTTAHPLLTTLDCPNPANLTPSRSVTTTALQSLALLNNAFMQQQAGYFAARVREESGPDPGAQSSRAFALAFGRFPEPAEKTAAVDLIKARGLEPFCRMLINANEFVYVD